MEMSPQGNLYFIKDSYFLNHRHKDLKPNKPLDAFGGLHNRPCYCALQEGKVLWMIPISSQINKYKNIYNKKISKGKDCDTIVFGYVKGNLNAFLIQNMIPVLIGDINNIYIDKSTKQPVTLNEKLKKKINTKTRKVLRLVRNGYEHIVFTPILELEKSITVTK